MKQVRRVLIIGAQGTGKSTFARVGIAGVSGSENQIVVEPDELGDGWKPYGYELTTDLRAPGLKRIVFDRYDKTFLNRISKNVFNQTLIFDDVLFLLTDVVKYRELEQILGRARQTGNNVIFTIHGVSSIPAPFWNYFTDIIIFKTYDKPDRASYKIPDFEKIERAIKTVNSHPEKRVFKYIRKDN